jgi:aspartate/methionine/tyrosine aminotransferase
VNSKGAFYLFPNISKTGLKSADFCARLLEAGEEGRISGSRASRSARTTTCASATPTSLANIEKGHNHRP